MSPLAEQSSHSIDGFREWLAVRSWPQVMIQHRNTQKQTVGITHHFLTNLQPGIKRLGLIDHPSTDQRGLYPASQQVAQPR